MLILASLSAELYAQNARTADSLKVALLPILDTFPFHVAQEKGYFEKAGVAVTGVPVATTANFNRDRIQVQIISSARKADPNYPLFRILSAPGSGLTSPADLKGVPIGISKNTIIEYVTDRLLAASGLTATQIVKKSIPVIPERFQLLLQGQVKAATLPDPLAKSALEAGAGSRIDLIEIDGGKIHGYPA